MRHSCDVQLYHHHDHNHSRSHNHYRCCCFQDLPLFTHLKSVAKAGPPSLSKPAQRAQWRSQLCTWIYNLERHRRLWPHALRIIQRSIVGSGGANCVAGASEAGAPSAADPDAVPSRTSAHSLRRLHFDMMQDGDAASGVILLVEQRIRELPLQPLVQLVDDWHALLSTCAVECESGAVTQQLPDVLLPVRVC